MARALILLLIAILSLTSIALGAGENSCSICHSDIKVDYQASIHADYSVTCVDCHGGDPTIMGMGAMDEKTGFKGKPTRGEIPKLCAFCHSDVERMVPYNIPIDQYTEYLTSKHGILLAQGDTEVAVCTDCHGTHRILPADAPESMVYPQNVPQTCAKCHSDEKLMAKYGIPADQLEGFTRGVHGVALLREGNRKAPDCATCHGTHGAVPPGVSDVSKVCGQCHTKTREFFNESPHKQAMDQRKISECSSCHGNHAIEPPGHGLFDSTCSECHSQDSESFLTGQKLKTVLVEAEEAVRRAEAELARAGERGFEVSAYRSRLLEAHSYLTEAFSIQHTLDLARVRELTRKARSLGEEIRGDALALISSTKVRLVGLAIVWVLLTFAILVLYLYKRRQKD
ncbi:MAG: cytochrome c3 family protein [Candidatus Bipolaricaulia bacterium]